MKFSKKTKYIISFFVIFLFFFWGGIKLNEKIEWAMTEEIIASSGLSVQLGLSEITMQNCLPSCQNPSGTSLCCAPQATRCAEFIPGVNGTYDSGCALFASVNGSKAGGTGVSALLSMQAIGQAGLSNGGQMIYGGTVDNMSMMAPGAPNAVLAAAGGCYNCLMSQGLIDEVFEKLDFIIASIREKF